jgi:hypothetical protein
MACFESKDVYEKNSLIFPFEESYDLNRQFKSEKTASIKTRKAESLFSTEIDLTTSSDYHEGDHLLLASVA